MTSQPSPTPNELTWAEFKRLVEAQGVKDTDIIGWIDMHGDRLPTVKRYLSSSSFIVGDGRSIEEIHAESKEDDSDDGAATVG